MDTPVTPPPLVHDHLERALDADTPAAKNYHIRSALQAFALEELHEHQETERESVRQRP